MAKSNLSTAKYYKQIAGAEEADVSSRNDGALRTTPGAWERIASRISLVVGAGVLVCAAILAIGYGSSIQRELSAQSKKKSSTSGWLERVSGVNVNQAFENTMSEISNSSSRDWDDKYRSSPVYQFENKRVDLSRMQGSINPARPAKQPARRSR